MIDREAYELLGGATAILMFAMMLVLLQQ